jgi:aromatic-L-amino-acid decarboxylase
MSISADEFRRHAHAFVDWMADYYAKVEDYPVRAQVEPGEIAGRLPAAAPEASEPIEAIFEDFEEIILPGMTHWQHPSFFAYFPANGSPPSLLAEMLTASLGAQCMSWLTSPAATELEDRMMEWLRDLLGLPEGFTGCIQDTASTGILAAIVTAREWATDFASNQKGLSGEPPLVLYCSAETHSATEKGAKIAGIGRDYVRKVALGPGRGIDPDVLAQMIQADRQVGLRPFCVVATLGSTGTGAMDPLKAIGAICKEENLWLHVDAAWAGSALILPETRAMIDGIEHVDSFVFNPHKWLFTNFDCSVFFIREPEYLIRSFEILPEFLKTREGARVNNYRDWGVPLGRRFRALKLWFVLRSYGADGLRAIIREHITLAQEIAQRIEAEPDFELVTPARLALFCFRYRPDDMEAGEALDALNERLFEALNDTGKVYFTQNRVDGAYVIRWQVGQTATRRAHVEAAWALVLKTARGLEI